MTSRTTTQVYIFKRRDCHCSVEWYFGPGLCLGQRQRQQQHQGE
jgi:hypothetical protein